MSRARFLGTYVAMLVGAVIVYLAIRNRGLALSPVLPAHPAAAPGSSDSSLASVLLALAVITLLARGLGAVFARWVGQPSVIGEIVAAIVLGPSLLGSAAPGAYAFLVPATVAGVMALACAAVDDVTAWTLGLLSSWTDWAWCAVIIVVATLGKVGGSAVAARLAGMGGRASTAIGILMNTRGLMELVVLGIGLDLGVIGPTLFAMLVLMAIVTTFATSPLLRWFVGAGVFSERPESTGARPGHGGFEPWHPA